MIQALNAALAGYTARSNDITRLAGRIRNEPLDGNLAGDMVGVVINQRMAEANLAVARVADQTSESMIHVIA
jgi:hypothetical protein